MILLLSLVLLNVFRLEWYIILCFLHQYVEQCPLSFTCSAPVIQLYLFYHVYGLLLLDAIFCLIKQGGMKRWLDFSIRFFYFLIFVNEIVRICQCSGNARKLVNCRSPLVSSEKRNAKSTPKWEEYKFATELCMSHFNFLPSNINVFLPSNIKWTAPSHTLT